ncbi:nitrilase-related carbon-nitrogen hydrolase [Microbacterium xanthum]|uniref:nitrilase-related carbon-nitrogen hydrolase n=1 Tax=Microbacterium xanthum TaxID=3079794 RepID=UPI002AD2560A|nr:nitrilase-related carbon-nitrogen hydrolase [Microbacterium sp. KSW-48]MDZ8170751.1 nitrilase-related carbon-nitrogen hydrolase [Microbacterium sp. KSW-48]
MAETPVHSIAVVQGAAVIDDVDQNLSTLATLVGEAAERGADVVVTPELFATGYAPERAWRHDGAAIRSALAGIARAASVSVVASSVDTAPSGTGDGAGASGGGAHRIAASVFTATGAEALRIHKRHLFGEVEKQWITPGDDYAQPFDWRNTRWGVGVCYDVEFPEFARAQARAGADVLLVPTAVPVVEEGVEGLGEAWHYSSSLISRLQVPARALENGVVIAYANHCGPGFTGGSCIATPFGRHAAHLGTEQGVAVVEVPLAAIRAARRVNTYLPDLSVALGDAPTPADS